MSDAPASNFGDHDLNREEVLSALFAQMVIQQTNMAMMLMGKVPHPQTGETVRDLEAARIFVDQLEMLQVKTKGNLNPDEERLLRQSLLSAQMMFVEAVEAPASAKPSASEPERPAPAGESTGPASAPSAATPAAEAEAEGESKKKFSKKY